MSYATSWFRALRVHCRTSARTRLRYGFEKWFGWYFNGHRIFLPGYTGHKPFLWPRFGEANVSLTTKALCDFTNSYQHRRSTEWEPIALAGAGTTQPSARVNEIYHKTIGLVPNYQGHVPGATFR